MNFSDIPIRIKLTTAFILVAVLPLITIEIYGNWITTQSLLEKSFDKLHTIQTLKKNRVEDSFADFLSDLRILSASSRLKSLNRELESYRNETTTLPTVSFAIDSDRYREIFEEFAPEYQQYIETYGYHDIKIISYHSGHVMFSLAGEKDLGTNLVYGRYRESRLADLWRKIVETEAITIADFVPFEPSGGMESLFIGAPVFNDAGVVDSVVVLQLGPSFFDTSMRSKEGLGRSGESYLIMYDAQKEEFEFRSNMVTMGKGNYIVGYEFAIPPQYWLDALEPDIQNKNKIYIDSAGNEVLVEYDRLDLPGIEWYLISKIDKAEVIAVMDTLLQQGLLVALFLCLFIVCCALSFARQIVRPIVADVQFAKSIAMGDLETTLKLDRKDELGVLAESLNDMAKNLRDLDWLKRGREGLDDRLRGEAGLESLGGKFISFLVEHMDGQLGAFYLFESNRLQLIANYGFVGEEDCFQELGLGEGLIGRAAQERSFQFFSKVDSALPAFNNGYQKESPTHHFAAPLVLEGKLIGAFWVAAFSAFTDLHQQFVEQNSKSVAIFMRMAISRRTIEELYEKAQEQQEELSVTNEELQERSDALEKSQKDLLAQQEELRVTNEELQERTETLEKQKSTLNDKTTELIKARLEIERKAKELERGSLYKSEFLANMSHELRTPLNSIIILSQMLVNSREENLSDKQIKSAKAIHTSGAELLQLIDDILDLSKVEAGKIDLLFEEVELAKIEKDLRRIFQEFARERGLSFSVEISDDLPPTIYTDSQRLQQILRNLLNNACKFTRKGAVRLKISRPLNADPGDEIKQNKMVAFAVLDDGIGIPRERQKEIFKAFQQADGSTSRKYGGTGLGLSISDELARLLGGSIHLESVVDKGSVFTIHLPERGWDGVRDSASPQHDIIATSSDLVVDGSERAGEKKENYLNPGDMVVGSAPQLKSKMLLVIDGDSEFGKRVDESAGQRGFKTIVAESGEQGLHYADYFRPKAILLEPHLSRIDGSEVLRRLNENSDLQHIPVVLVSATDYAEKAPLWGARGFLQKPVSDAELEEVLKKVDAFISSQAKSILVADGDSSQANSIGDLLRCDDIEVVSTTSGEASLAELKSGSFDCLVLDLELADMEGLALLRQMQNCEVGSLVPVIVYTGRNLKRAEEEELRKYTESIIIKDGRSSERLVEETAVILQKAGQLSPISKKTTGSKNNRKHFEGKTILVVDDDMRNVFALSSLLEDKGVEISIARDGEEALEKLGESSGVDLVLMDIMMPKMDGYEAMIKIRKEMNLTELPIIALTAKAMKGDRNKCIDAGANDYLAKPVDAKKLLSILKVWLY